MKNHIAVSLDLAGITTRFRAEEIYRMLADISAISIDEIRFAYEQGGDNRRHLLVGMLAPRRLLPDCLKHALHASGLVYCWRWDESDDHFDGFEAHDPTGAPVSFTGQHSLPYKVADSAQHLHQILEVHPQLKPYMRLSAHEQIAEFARRHAAPEPRSAVDQDPRLQGSPLFRHGNP